MLCDLASLQDQEVGDGTTSVVILAAELLKRANELVKQKIHPTNIIVGFKIALKEGIKFLKKELTIKTVEERHLISAAKTSMSSKIIGPECTLFSRIAVDAMLNVRTVKENGKVIYPLKAINILKTHGKSSIESELVDGYAINLGRAAQGMPKRVENAKIALLDFGLARFKASMGIDVNITDVTEAEKIKENEIKITKDRIQAILKSGANVILTSKGIDDLCLKYFVEAGAIAVRRLEKSDLRRISKATGGTIVATLADMEGEESFDSELLGTCEAVVEERVGDGDVIYFRKCSKTAAQTIILRGANEYMLDEIDRSLHDALCVVKRCLESKTLVAGGGAVEGSLATHLLEFANEFDSKQQLAISEFANALLVIPRVLAYNAAKDATDLIAKLKAAHYKGEKYSGLDLVKGKIVNNYEAGVLEPAISKVKSLRFATEAAITILRIDDLIRLDPANEPN